MWSLKVATQSSPWQVSLANNEGRQVWEYDPEGGTSEDRKKVDDAREHFWANRFAKKHSSDELMRQQLTRERPSPPMPPKPSLPAAGAAPKEAAKAALTRAIRFYSTLQTHDGHFAGDYGGPMFLMPGLLISLYVSGTLNTVLSEHHRREMRHYLYAHQNPDGGWGLHIEGHSTMFGSALSYVSLRILGEGPDSTYKDAPGMSKGREWILAHGSATHITSWGKFWLSVLGCFSWDGNNPLPPEIWLLPYVLPIHPGRFWCHCRQVYLPMCYVYGKRFVGKETSLVLALREELFSIPYSQVDWNRARNQCAKEDLYYPHPLLQDVLWATLHKGVEPLLNHTPLHALREKACAEVMKHVHYEDENTRYIDIGPVNKALNLLCCFVEDPSSEALKKHLARVPDYLWLAEDGMKMQGYNGSQLWDTAFAVQALAATEMLEETAPILKRANHYVDKSQVRENPNGDHGSMYRHISNGAWPFSTRDHGWPIADCASEGLKASLAIAALPPHLVGPPLADQRLFDCVNCILSFQNADGGFATYELTRSYAWLEYINPAETFGDIMIDYTYVECTSACVTAMAAFQKRLPDHRAAEVAAAIARAAKFMEDKQLEDGSWYGSWAVCYTYATWFGVSGLLAAGRRYESCPAIRKACAFLLSKELLGGGWSESYLSCQDKIYTTLPGNRVHAVMTSWALIALIEAGQHTRDAAPLHRGAAQLIKLQEENGDFPQQEISGVFNKNCMISYSAYRNIFPIWALGLYQKVCGGS
ncbi:cycloartenol synthase [Klebsormidium nitens]|uniref:Terpene cyclase/mutase family member n=1 Tax=Klebsormidium nitens TaxID=105231 RepID=A0A1Y1HSM3_KLENI|nr:cycloartenol synthase [Klebsormidium nitens]|eukprot:GAQ81630.1 cycloartenol synthase [Klebsormidium nitens]